MSKFEWNSQWLKCTEQQSQHLITLLDQAYHQSSRGGPIENLGVVVEGLVEMSESFNLAEFLAFREVKVGSHREDHEEFMNRVTELRNAYYGTNAHVSLHTLSSLINWLTHLKLRIVRNSQYIGEKK